MAIFSHLRAMLTDPGIVPITIENECKNKKKIFQNDLNEDSFTDSDDDVLIQKLRYVVIFINFLITISLILKILLRVVKFFNF